MVDRLEELLEIMEAKDEDEEREDVLTLTDRTVPGPVSPEEDDDREANPAGEGGHWEAPANSAVEGMDRGVPLTAENQASGWESLPENGLGEGAAIPVAEAAQRREVLEMAEKAAAVAVRMTGKSKSETFVTRRSVEQGGEPEQAAGHKIQSGLEGLYRRAVQASRPAAQNLPVDQAGWTHRAEEPGRTAALTVDELDRAVRRDSRRYDGGITIF